jgi:hypothetical protein
MRVLLIASLALLATGLFVTDTFAQQEPSLQERLAARRELEIAKSELLYYWQVDYPRRCRDLDAAIELTRTAIENNRLLLREYRPYTTFSIGEPFPITVRNLKMCIAEKELRLNDLLAERNALTRFKGEQFRVLQLNVYEARLRVAELEAQMPPLTETETTNPAPTQRR